MDAVERVELLPCPFCGGKVVAVVALEHAYWIEHAERGSCLVFDDGIWASDFEWNTRSALSLARSNGWQDMRGALADALSIAECLAGDVPVAKDTWRKLRAARDVLDRLRGSEDDYCGIVVMPEDESNV